METGNVVHLQMESPELSPMVPGLPSTPIVACQALMGAIAFQALIDDDLNFILTPTFLHWLIYAGVDPDIALQIKIKYLRDEIDPERLSFQSFNAARAVESGMANWGAWNSRGGLALHERR